MYNLKINGIVVMMVYCPLILLPTIDQAHILHLMTDNT